jgi:hypothetical protein
VEPIEGPLVEEPQPVVAVREPPRFAPSLGAVGGLFAVGGALGLIGQLVEGDSDGGRILAGVLALLVGAAALVARTRAPDGPVATALVAVVAIAAGAGVLLILVDPSSVDGASSLTAPMLFAAIVWLVLFFAGPVKGRPFLLGLALLAVWFGALSLVDPFDTGFTPDVSSRVGAPVEDGFTFEEDAQFEEEPPIAITPAGFDPTGAVGDLGAVSLLFGVGYLIASAAFDRQRRGDVSTPFVAAGLVATTLGLVGVSVDIGSVPGALFTLLIAGAVCWMGAAHGRRLSTWLGAAGVAIGLSVLVDKIDGRGNEVASSLIAIAVGAALVAASMTALRKVDAP